MVRIVVFDSGFGSLSIIKSIKKVMNAEIIYFADQQNFPYGKKSYHQLKKIINKTLKTLENKFNPDVIVVGSNTPSILLLRYLHKSNLLGVFPPLKEASKKTKSSSIAILTTQNVVKSKALSNLIKKNLSKKVKVTKINASPLIELVETGRFIDKKNFCKNKINSILNKPFLENNVDVATLSSTHLPFLLPMFHQMFPKINFLDPSEHIAIQIAKNFVQHNNKKNSLKIFTSGKVSLFQKQLSMIGIKNKVNRLSIL